MKQDIYKCDFFLTLLLSFLFSSDKNFNKTKYFGKKMFSPLALLPLLLSLKHNVQYKCKKSIFHAKYCLNAYLLHGVTLLVILCTRLQKTYTLMSSAKATSSFKGRSQKSSIVPTFAVTFEHVKGSLRS